jgi:hypothetical protein
MRLILLCIALASFTASFAQQDWIAQNGPYGGEIRDVEYDAASGWTYAIIGSDLHYSEDLGITWTVVSSLTFPSGVDIEISNGTVYFLQGYELYTSPAGEDNFVEVSTGSGSLNSSKIRRMPNGTLVATSSLGIAWLYYSVNNGVSWAITASGSNNFDPNFLEVTSDNKVIVINIDYNATPTTRVVQFTSVLSSGTTFSTFGSALANVHSIATNNDGSTVYAVTDLSFYQVPAAGGTWTTIEGGDAAAGTVSNSTNPSFLEFSADGGDMYFIDNHNHELHHKTTGAPAIDWTENSNGFPGAGRIIKRASAISGTEIFLGTYTDLFLTSGTSYSQRNGTITEVAPKKLGAYGNVLFMHAGQSFGFSPLYKSTTEGNTWEGEPQIPGSVASFTYNKDFATNPSDAAFALVHNLEDDLNPSDLYRKIGTNWSVVGSVPEFEWVDLTEDGQAMGFGFGPDNAFYYSSDIGTGWTTISASGLPISYQMDPEKTMMASPLRMFAYVMDLNTATSEWYRIDFNALSSFASATAITGNLPFTTIDKVISKNGNLYLFDDSTNPDRYSISFDGGFSWVNRTVEFSGSTEFLVADNGYIFLVNRFVGDMYMSRNNGVSYVPTALPGLDVSQYIEDVFLDHEGYAVLALSQNVVYKSRNVVVTPLTPTTLLANAITKNTISLDWVDVAYNEEYYKIERSTDGTNYTQVGQVLSSQACDATVRRVFYMDRDLDPEIEYTYRITAVNDAGSSAALTAAFTTLPDCPNESLPDGRSWFAENAGGNGFAATTMSNVGIRHISGNVYEVQNITMGLVGFSAIVGRFTLDCNQTVVIEDQFGQIKPNGQGTWDSGTNTLTLKWLECGEDNFETVTFSSPGGGAPPTTPVVQALVKSDTEVEISWITGFNQKEFVVERATAGPAGPYSQIGGGSVVPYPGDTFVDPGPFVIGTPYYYRVTANNVIIPTPLTAEGFATVVFDKPNFILSATEITNLVTISFNTVWGDFDGDGLDDLLTLSASGPAPEYLIFKNLGNGNFSKNIIDLEDKVYLNLSAIDFNNDGKLDLGVAETDGTEVELYQGNGDLSFIKLSSGLVGDIATNVEGQINSISWSDVNRDGRLDVLVMAQDPDDVVVYAPQLFTRGAGGTYTKVSGGNLTTQPSEAEFALWADYDNDGLTDVLLVDVTLCKLYKNAGSGTFTEQPSSGIVDAASSAAWGDYNADGLMDLYLGRPSGHFLYRNNGDGTFTKDVSTSITTDGNFSLAPVWADINNDGLPDLITAGYAPSISSFGAGKVFINTSTGPTASFLKVTTEMINDSRTGALGGATSDYNKDGFVDIALPRSSVVTGFVPSNFTLYRNNNTTGNWVEVRLVGNGTTSNKGAVDAQVFVKTPAGKNLLREVRVLEGARSQNSNNLHFGIGSETSINEIEVYWPRGGASQVYSNPPINTALVIEEDVAGPVENLLSPADASANASVSTTVEITFNEPTVAQLGKNIYITRVGDATVVRTKAVTTGVKNLNKYTFTFTGQLDPSEEYEVSFDANSFTDVYGNAFAGLGNAWTFTTRDAPAVTATEPLDAATTAAPNTILSVTFDVPATAVASKQLNVYLSSDLATAVHTVNATSSVPGGNKHTFTLASPLLSNTDYTVKVDAGSFNSTTAGPTPYVEWSFKTAQGPQVTATSPADEATSVALDADMEVTFGVVTTPVSGKALRIYKASAPTVEIEAVDATDATASGMTQIFDLPSNLDAGTVYNAELDAGAFRDATLGTSLPEAWSFTTVPVPTVASRVPLIGAVDVAPNTEIKIAFNLPTTPVPGKKLFVYPGPVLTGAVDEIDVSDVVTNVNEHTFTLTSVLFSDHDFTVVIEEGAFVSATNGPTPEVQWAFTTAPGPVLSAITPEPGFVNTAPNTIIALSANVEVTPVSGKNLSIFLMPDESSAVYSLNVTDGVFDTDHYEFTLLPVLLTSSDYKVVVDEGAYEDAQGGISSSLTWSFTTAPGPAIVSTTPLGGASSAAPNTDLTISFGSVLTTAVPSRQIKVYKTANQTTPEHTLNATLSAGSSAAHIYDLTTNLDMLTSYTVKVDAGSFVNDEGGTSPYHEWEFTTAGGPAAPAVVPLNGATNIAPNTTLRITFAVETTPLDGKTLNVYYVSDPNNPEFTVNVNSVAPVGNQYTYTLPGTLDTGQPYRVVVDEGAFANLQGGTSAEFEWSFTTQPAFSSATFTPLNGATNVAPNTTLTIGFSFLTTKNVGELKVFKSPDDVTPEYIVNVTEAVTSGNNHVFTLSGDLGTNAQYTVEVDGGAFKNAGDALSGPLVWSFSTKQGPAAATFTPADGATNVATNGNIGLNFSVATTAVAGKEVNIYRSDDLGTPIRTLLATAAFPDNNKRLFTIDPPLPTSTFITVIADEGAFRENATAALSPLASWSFETMDGPEIALLSPLDGATAVAANTKLEITFDQNVTAEAGKMIRLFKQGDINPVWETLVTSVPPVGSKFSFTVSPRLQGETNYTVLVEAGAFIDTFGNPTAAVGSTQWNFVTDVGPAATGFLPANNATNVSTIAAIEITFSRPLADAVSGKRIQVLDAGAEVGGGDVSTTGLINGAKYTLSAPGTQWPAGKLLTVVLDAGAFVDAGGNESAAITSGTYRFTTEVGPLLTSRSPGVGATEIPPNAPLVLTFDKDISPVAGKTIKVMNGANAVLNSNVLQAGIAGAVYTHAAPAGGWPLNTTLAVLLDAGAFTDATLKPSQAITGTQWTFTTINVTDEEDPVITFTAESSVPSASKPTFLQATVTDNVGVATTFLHIRAIGGTTFDEVAPSAAPVAGTYTYSVPSGSFDATGAQYYFTANDGSNNSVRKPAGENEYFTTYVTYAESTVPSGFVGEGITKTSWRVMSVPFDLGNDNAVSSVFAELTTGDPVPVYKKDWRMLALDPEPKWLDYNAGFTTVERGKAYMITMKTRRPLIVGANLTAPNNTRANLFPLSLKAGWNLVGNPYLSQIDWDDVATFNGLDGSALVFKKFSSGSYTDNSVIAPFDGGFVNVGTDMTVLIPFLDQVEAEGGRTKDIVFEDGDWVMPITLKHDGLENTFGGVGMHHQSGPAFDALDNFNGPRFIDFIEMNFDHPQHFPKHFSRDVVANQEEYTWEFNVEGNGEGFAEMSWDAGVVLPAGTELYLWDEGSQIALNMSGESSYEFDPRHSRKFRIYFGKNAHNRIASDRSLLGNPYPNPTTGISYIPFALPEGNAQYGVRIEVFDVMGRKTGTITDGSYAPGVYRADWEAQEVNSAGLYTVRMTVVTGELQEVYSARIQLNK